MSDAKAENSEQIKEVKQHATQQLLSYEDLHLKTTNKLILAKQRLVHFLVARLNNEPISSIEDIKRILTIGSGIEEALVGLANNKEVNENREFLTKYCNELSTTNTPKPDFVSEDKLKELIGSSNNSKENVADKIEKALQYCTRILNPSRRLGH